MVGGGAPRIGLGLALVYLQVHRALGRSGPGDDRVGLLLAGLMLVASATTTEDPRWLLAWLAWSVALPLTLLPAGLGRVSSALHWMAAALVVSVVLGGLLVYPLMPRLRTDELPSDRALTGFNDTVELGVLGQLLDDPQEVFRVSSGTVPLEGPVYFRGVALDRFDGRTWFTTLSFASVAIAPAAMLT